MLSDCKLSFHATFLLLPPMLLLLLLLALVGGDGGRKAQLEGMASSRTPLECAATAALPRAESYGRREKGQGGKSDVKLGARDVRRSSTLIVRDEGEHPFRPRLGLLHACQSR